MKGDSDTTIEELKERLREFIAERDWQKYHHPKDVAESICIEAAELLELFQWRSAEEIRGIMKKDDEFKERIAEELADVVIYSFSMANNTRIDITQAVIKKIEENEKKYPAEKYRGKAHLNQI